MLWEITVEIDESANPQFYSTIGVLPNARFAPPRQRRADRCVDRGGCRRILPVTRAPEMMRVAGFAGRGCVPLSDGGRGL